LGAYEQLYSTMATELGDRLLTIGEFARRSRLSPKALRLYERQGFLIPARVDRENGYRRYGENQLTTARLIAMLRRIDMPLAQVAEVVAAAERQSADVTKIHRQDRPSTGNGDVQSTLGAAAAAIVAAYWQEVENRIASQRQLSAHIQRRLLGEEGSFEMYQVQERDVPEQTVLTEQRHIHAHELPTWIPAAGQRLIKAAENHGGLAGPMTVIYHGEVNQDSDGPVEVCIPVGSAEPDATDAAMRSEPAHHEAYVRITKAQVAYPQILSAFDAVAQWIGSNGKQVAAAPREIYFADWDAAGPNDEVCDVSFPIE
jgi:DNA-binding transcriptional MerR regulator